MGLEFFQQLCCQPVGENTAIDSIKGKIPLKPPQLLFSLTNAYFR
jgi:hypothetical protein